MNKVVMTSPSIKPMTIEFDKLISYTNPMCDKYRRPDEFVFNYFMKAYTQPSSNFPKFNNISALCLGQQSYLDLLSSF